MCMRFKFRISKLFNLRSYLLKAIQIFLIVLLPVLNSYGQVDISINMAPEIRNLAQFEQGTMLFTNKGSDPVEFIINGDIEGQGYRIKWKSPHSITLNGYGNYLVNYNNWQTNVDYSNANFENIDMQSIMNYGPPGDIINFCVTAVSLNNELISDETCQPIRIKSMEIINFLNCTSSLILQTSNQLTNLVWQPSTTPNCLYTLEAKPRIDQSIGLNELMDNEDYSYAFNNSVTANYAALTLNDLVGVSYGSEVCWRIKVTDLSGKYIYGMSEPCLSVISSSVSNLTDTLTWGMPSFCTIKVGTWLHIEEDVTDKDEVKTKTVPKNAKETSCNKTIAIDGGAVLKECQTIEVTGWDQAGNRVTGFNDKTAEMKCSCNEQRSAEISGPNKAPVGTNVTWLTYSASVKSGCTGPIACNCSVSDETYEWVLLNANGIVQKAKTSDKEKVFNIILTEPVAAKGQKLYCTAKLKVTIKYYCKNGGICKASELCTVVAEKEIRIKYPLKNKAD
jgi:hypothetical protein